MHKVRKVFPPKKEVIKDISLSFFYGAKIGVIGPNGSGKSTLLKIITGLETEFFGELSREKNIRFGYLPQEPQLDKTKTVKENIMGAMAETVQLLSKFEELSAKMGETLPDEEMQKVMDEFAEVQEKIEKCGGWELERKIDIAMEALRVPAGDMQVEKLSGGEKRRTALCRLLLENHDVLILDEPTNHLDAESVWWLEQYLQNFPGTVIAVTHDRYFLDNAAQWILELEAGEGIPFKGNYTAWLETKEERLRIEEKSESRRRQTLRNELEWIRKSPTARQAKNKARITSYETLLSQETKKHIDACEISIPVPPRLGDKVIEFSGVTKGYGDIVLIDNFSAIIPPGAIVGIMGPNGAGKTTLFKMLTGEEKPDSGQISIGDTVRIGYVDQSRESLDGKKTVWEEISGGLDEIQTGGKTISSRAYAGSFGFKGSDQQTYVSQLSGGERNRLHLAKMLKSGSNVLLLDEPTNDLDVATLRALEEALLYFAGCVLTISHDRFFLDKICTHILAYEDEGRQVFFNGNFTEYESFKMKQSGRKEVKPTKMKFKKIKE